MSYLAGRKRMNADLVKLIWGQKAAKGYTNEQMGQMIGCSGKKIWTIKGSPADYLSDLLTLSAKMQIPLEDFKNAIQYP